MTSHPGTVLALIRAAAR